MANLEENLTEVEILKFNLYDLPSYRDATAAQEDLVNNNPYIEIVDKESYEEGKKRRTALLKGRTSLQDGEKFINRRLTDIKRFVSDETGRLIAITQPHEDKQQAEVKRHEAEEADKKNEVIRLENERKLKIKDQIEKFRRKSVENIYNATCQNINEVISEIQNFSFDVAEFGEDLSLVKSELSLTYDRKKKFLDGEEDLRKNRIKMELAKERTKLLLQYGSISNKDLSEITEVDFNSLLSVARGKFLEEQQLKEIERKKNEAREAEFKKLVAEKQQRDTKEKARLEAENLKLLKDQRRKEAEERALIGAENRKKAEEEQNRKLKEEAEHQERIRPDKEKITNALRSTTIPMLELSDENLRSYYESVTESFEAWKNQIINSLN